MANLCSIGGCGKPTVNVRGWCKAHYQRWYRHGDPLMRTRLANGEAETYLRDVVMAYDGNDCIFWPYSKGRAMMSRDGRHATVARVVCEEHHGAPPAPDYEAAHSCGKGHGGCVTKGHLSWKTAVENASDKHLHGTMARGESHGRTKLKRRTER